MNARFHTCLLIDDNPLENFINANLILRGNFADEVMAFESTEEALNLIRNQAIHPDVIFLDIRMPVMDGFKFLREYAKIDANDNTTIFMLSSSCNPRDIANATNSKYITKFIQKPLTSEKLSEQQSFT